MVAGRGRGICVFNATGDGLRGSEGAGACSDGIGFFLGTGSGNGLAGFAGSHFKLGGSKIGASFFLEGVKNPCVLAVGRAVEGTRRAA